MNTGRIQTSIAVTLLSLSFTVHSEELRARAIFEEKCVLCHGYEGKGDGRMQKLLDPPPSNFHISELSLDSMVEIITNGGESVGRSISMPPWSSELTELEIEMVANYVFGLRNH